MEKVRIVETSQGGQKLHHNGYVYYRRLNIEGKTYWKCSLKWKCNATAITQRAGQFVEIIKEGEHNHTPQESEYNHTPTDEEDASEEDVAEQNSIDENATSEAEDESSSGEEEAADDNSDNESADGVLWYPWCEDSEDEDLEEGDDGWGLKQTKVKHYRPTLRALRDGDASLRESIYSTADKGLICLLCEICRNVLHGKISLLKKDKTILRIFKDQIRLFASEDLSWQEKKELLCEDPQDTTIPVLLSVVWGCL